LSWEDQVGQVPDLEIVEKLTEPVEERLLELCGHEGKPEASTQPVSQTFDREEDS
jgi:hypothetical protein